VSSAASDDDLIILSQNGTNRYESRVRAFTGYVKIAKYFNPLRQLLSRRLPIWRSSKTVTFNVHKIYNSNKLLFNNAIRLDAKKILETDNLLHFHGGGTVVNVTFDGGQLAQSANNNVLVNAMRCI